MKILHKYSHSRLFSLFYGVFGRKSRIKMQKWIMRYP